MSDIAEDVAALARSGVEVLYADPPWKFKSNSEISPGRNAARHYRTMTIPQICALPVKEMMAKDSVCFLWITTPFLIAGHHLPVFKAWGFKPSGNGFVWIKTKASVPWHYKIREDDLFMGGGLTTRKNCELCIMGVRGRSLRKNASVREVVIAPVREHSRKPDEIAERIKTYVGPGRRMVEMFSRSTTAGFIALGNEAGKFDDHRD